MDLVSHRVADGPIATGFTSKAQAEAAADIHSDHGPQEGYAYELREYRDEGWFVYVTTKGGTFAGWLRV